MITKVKKSQLGWFGRFTTIHINEKAGRIAETNRLRKYLDKNAKISFGILLVFMLLVFLGGLAGFALLIGYIVYRKVNKSTNLVIPPYADQPITVADSFAGAFNIYFWLYSFSGIYLSFLFGGLFKRIANTGSIEKTLFVLLAYDVIIVGLAVIWLTKFAGGKGISLRAIGWRTDNFWEDVAWGFGGYLATIPFLILAVIIAAFFDNVLPSKANPIGEIAEMTSTFSGRLLVLAMASVFAPLVEETFFRGVLFPAIWRRTRRLWLAIFASALFFAFVHPQFLSGALAITIIGSFLALLYAERRSLIPGAVMHAIHNTVLMILIFLLYSR
jgi:membrane protease YdiL (CAAX protease family)